MILKINSYARVALAGILLCALIVGISVFNPLTQSHAATSGFVTVDSTGRQLQLNGQPYRFSGANIYWLGTGVAQSGVSFDTQISSILQVASQAPDNGMSGSVVRSNTLGESAGCGNSYCVEPTLNNIPATSNGWTQLDYAISQAGKDNLRLVIPFVDNWDYGPGGITTWTNWVGDSNASDFYTNTTIIKDFETFIGAILNHTNSITGVQYKNDPTILAWEEGNELNDAPTSWISTIATYIKSQDSHHLVSFGAQNGLARNNSLSVKNVDIEDGHYYPMSASNVVADAKTAYQNNKVFYAGEYGWNTGDLNGFLSAIESTTAGQGYYISGDTYWDLFPKGVDHADSSTANFTMHYPGDTAAMSASAALLTNHARIMASAGTASSAPVGKTIWLKAQSNGDYVSAWSSDTNTPLEARSTAVSTWEEFTVVDAGNGNIALKALANGDYASARTDTTNGPVDAEATALQDWETFSWIANSDGTISLAAHGNGLYVSAWTSDTNTPLEARSTHTQSWEKFTWGQV